MNDILEFKPRPKTEPKVMSQYKESRKLVATIEVFSDGTVNTQHHGNNYDAARIMAKAMVFLTGTAETPPTADDRVISAMARCIDDIIDIQVSTNG